MAKTQTTEPRRRKPLSGLDADDIMTLKLLVFAAIEEGRLNPEKCTNPQLARLFALDSKLAKIAETRGGEA